MIAERCWCSVHLHDDVEVGLVKEVLVDDKCKVVFALLQKTVLPVSLKLKVENDRDYPLNKKGVNIPNTKFLSQLLLNVM